MVYRFKLVSDEVSNFSREIEVDSESTFLQLRNAILDSVDYSKGDIDSFFICDDDWTRKNEITQEDMGSSSDQDIWLMADTPISELVEDKGQKLIFVFDYITERSFFMELKDIISGRNLAEPVCTLKKGKAPSQVIDINEFDKKVDQAASQQLLNDMDDEFYGDTHFNDDELAEGFDDLNFS